MKTLLRLAALAAVAGCASATTHVQITLTINDGTTAAKGYLYAVGPKGGPHVATSRKLTIGASGVVDEMLQGCPACYYDVEYHFQDAQGRNAASPPNEKWFIPVTATTLTSRLQLLGGSAAPANMVNPQQVNAGGLLPGQLWIWSGTAWEAAYPASSSDAGVADPGLNGLMVRSALNVSRPATFADIVGLFSGAGDYLKRDGTLGTPAGGPGGTGAFADLDGLPSDNAALNAALSAKANTSDLTSHTSRQDNPHVVTRTQIGLSNVVNFLQLQAGLNLSDLSNVVTARTNLGLGAAALLGVGTSASTVAAGDHLHSSTYAALIHGHAATEITSGVFGHARLGTGGTGGGANVLWDDGTWHAPPGASGGEANTASNGGTGGIGLALPKSGTDLPFKSLIAGSTKLALTDDAGNKRISLDVAEANIVHQNISGAGSNTHGQIDTHLGSTSNPHNTTAAQVGLGSVNNTPDAGKPVSTAQQAAINARQAVSEKDQNGGYVGRDSSGNATIPGTITAGGISTAYTGVAQIAELKQGTAPASPAANSFQLRAPTSIPAAYFWTVPGADAAGGIVSDGSGLLAIKTYQGNGSKFLLAGTVAGTGAALCTDVSGNATTTGCTSGGTTVNVNGSSVASPNFNGTTPAAESGYRAVKFQVSGSSVSAEVPPIVPTDLPGEYYALSSGSANAYVVTPTTAVTAYVPGEKYYFKASFANTGAATVAYSGLANVPIKKPQSAITTDLATNDVRNGQMVAMMFDGTNMQMYSQLGNAPSASVAYGTTAGTATEGNDSRLVAVGKTPMATDTAVQASQMPALTGDCTTSAGAVSTTCAAKMKTWSCQPGIGDGLGAIPAGTYAQSICYNDTGTTVTLSGIKCYSDNSGTSTMAVTNGAGTALLTGAVTCSPSFAAGTQSATVTLASGDFLKFSFVADGTSKQSTWVITGGK